MPINVIYQNGETGSVEEYQLYELIAQNKIKKFGWCTIVVDPVRKEERIDYKSPEEKINVKKVAKAKCK